MVITIEDGLLGITSDSRTGFRRWGKRLSRSDVDLTQSNGRSLGGEWLTWGKSYPIADGEYVVLAAETGSRKSHSYSHRLGVVRGGELVRVTKEEQNALLDAAPLTDAEKAGRANSWLYLYALYIHHAASVSEPQSPAPPATNPLASYSDDELLAELARRGLITN